MKLVRRGERVQGLAFAEGLDRRAPGCAASRIDRRCALSALERRFGPFAPERAPVTEIARPRPWSDTVRPTILTAVDAAKSWEDLAERLSRDGIVIKLVQRGTRVQGLAFAQGRDPDAPGCGASRIDPRCRKTALEQRFGPFPETEQQRARASEPNIPSDPRGPIAVASVNARSMMLIAIPPGRCVRPARSPTTLGCVPTMLRTAIVSSPNAIDHSAVAGMQRGSASACSGSVKLRSAAKRASCCAQWRGWARADCSRVSLPIGRLTP